MKDTNSVRLNPCITSGRRQGVNEVEELNKFILFDKVFLLC